MKANNGKYALYHSGQRSKLLKLETRLEWLGCAMAVHAFSGGVGEMECRREWWEAE